MYKFCNQFKNCRTGDQGLKIEQISAAWYTDCRNLGNVNNSYQVN